MEGSSRGHLIFLDHATTGDGVVAALQVLAIMVAESRPVSELATVLERVPQVLESIRLPEKRPLGEMPLLSRQMQRVEKRLGKRGRLLVRWSGTEPKLRLMVEGPNPSILSTMVSDMAAAAKKDLAGC